MASPIFTVCCSVEEQMEHAALAYYDLLEGKDKPVVGSTCKYKNRYLSVVTWAPYIVILPSQPICCVMFNCHAADFDWLNDFSSSILEVDLYGYLTWCYILVVAKFVRCGDVTTLITAVDTWLEIDWKSYLCAAAERLNSKLWEKSLKCNLIKSAKPWKLH